LQGPAAAGALLDSLDALQNEAAAAAAAAAGGSGDREGSAVGVLPDHLMPGMLHSSAYVSEDGLTVWRRVGSHGCGVVVT
jgi:hypothetical protein